MWSDNETKDDLIGFRVHADLIRSVVTDPSLLPVVLGVFGDWGGGKSSIMRMLEHDLKGEKYKDTVCLYFNGWMFEGYEDAKTALLSSILVQLGEHERFGPKVKKQVTGLLKRVKWMELGKLGIKHIGVPLIAASLTGGLSALPAAAAALLPSALSLGSSEADKSDTEKDEEKDEENETNWFDLIEKAPGKPDLLEVRKFRDGFEKMLDETEIHSLVILIDDLDRCLPERIIETLEAIKLFVAVPKTAFVIGADPRIVRHAIATRYVAKQISDTPDRDEGYDLVKDYLEKLIQIPYLLPRLSPAEIETYINLLACQKYLANDQCASVLGKWAERRSGNFYAAFQHGAIKDVLGASEALKGALGQQLTWSNAVAPVLTEGLKGNPRQVKRMLNAMLLRKQLASIAGIEAGDEILAKLMVLEYTHEDQFRELDNWQAAEGGYPEKLKKLENAALGGDAGEQTRPDDSLSKWNKPSLQGWLRMQPALGNVDLRDYFWLARDRTSSTLAGVNMVSPIVRRLFEQLTKGNRGEQNIATRESAGLDELEQESLLRLLQQRIERHPDDRAGPEALALLIEQKLPGAVQALADSLRKADANSLQPAIAFRIQGLGKSDPTLTAWANDLIGYLSSQKNTKVGKAAAKTQEG